MKVAAWNVNSLNVRLPHLVEWLEREKPDIVCLQELKLEDAKFPCAALKSAGYQCAFSGQKTYNGVAILSRTALSEISSGTPDFSDDHKRVISAMAAVVRVVCVYCPFRLSEEPEKSFSWCGYRMMGFRRNAGLRIDQILVSAGLAPRCIASTIRKAPRKLERPSDHAPVIAEFC